MVDFNCAWVGNVGIEEMVEEEVGMHCKACGKHISDYHGTLYNVYLGDCITENLCQDCACFYWLVTSDCSYWVAQREALLMAGSPTTCAEGE